MTVPVRVLVVEDDAATRRAVVRALEASGVDLAITECGDGREAERLLREGFDCALLDYQLPGKDGLALLRESRASGLPTAFVLLTARGDETLAVEAMHAGAADYLPKSALSAKRLEISLRRALRVRQAEQETAEALDRLRANQERLNRTMESIADGVLIADRHGRYVFANPAAQRILGLPAEAILGQLYHDPPWRRMRLDGSEFDLHEHPLRRVLESGQPATNIEFAVERRDGRRIMVAVSASLLRDAAGRLDGLVTVFRDVTEAKHAEETLRQGERFVRQLVNTTPALLYIYDLQERRNIYSNRELTAILGYTPAQAIEMGGAIVERLLHPEDRERVAEHHRRLAGTAEDDVLEIEYRMRSAAGEWRWLRSRDSSFLRAADGSTRQVIGTALDITESRQAEQRLRESEARYRSLFEDSPVALWEEDFSLLKARLSALQESGVRDLEAHLRADREEFMRCRSLVRVVDVNRAAMQLYEAEDRQWLLMGLHQVTGPEADEALLASMLASAEGRRQFQIEASQRTLAGQVRQVSVSWSVAPGFEQSYAKVILSIVDITQLKAAEEALRQTNERLEALINASPLGVCFFDMDWKLQLWSPAMERIFGWTAAEALGRTIPFIAGDAQAEAEYGSLRQRLEKGRTFTGLELRRQRRDGAPVDISLSTATLRNSAGRLVGIMALVEDITDAKRMKERLLQAHRMETVGRLAGGVAHDFNNLLAVISGYSEALSRHLGPEHPQLPHVQEIQRAADRGAAVTRQLLTFSRRQGAPPPRVIDLNALATAVQRMLRHTVSSKIDIQVRHHPEPLPVCADATQMEQVLVNLALNARDAMPDGGMLSIALGRSSLDAGEAGPLGLGAGEHAMLEVRDTGHGVPEAIREKIFEPFFTTKERTGTGLGLSIVYEIVRQSGGAITLESAPGKGAAFRILLPLADAGELE